MFVSMEGVQILALGWLRNDSVATGTKSSCRGFLPPSVKCLLLHTHPWGLERHREEWSGMDTTWVEEHGMEHSPRKTLCCVWAEGTGRDRQVLEEWWNQSCCHCTQQPPPLLGEEAQRAPGLCEPMWQWRVLLS